jgi:hypothetical protein
MDARKFKITIDWAKHLKKEKVDLEVRLHSHADDFKKFTKTSSVYNLMSRNCYVPIT